MSYDFRLCFPRDDLSREEIATTDSDEIEIRDIDPVKETRKRRIADALIAKDAKLEPFAFGFEEIAISQSLS